MTRASTSPILTEPTRSTQFAIEPDHPVTVVTARPLDTAVLLWRVRTSSSPYQPT